MARLKKPTQNIRWIGNPREVHIKGDDGRTLCGMLMKQRYCEDTNRTENCQSCLAKTQKGRLISQVKGSTHLIVEDMKKLQEAAEAASAIGLARLSETLHQIANSTNNRLRHIESEVAK